MKNVIAAIVIALMATTAQADSDVECTGTDVAIGVAGGVIAATATAISTVVAMPLVGAGVAAGSQVGLAGAFSASVLQGTTIPALAVANTILAPIYGTVLFYGSCVTASVMELR